MTGTRMASRPATGGASTVRRRGFSLIEVLIAIFILGIGVLGIAALFPAGIAMQRRAVDDTIGPLVADNALVLIRSKVRPEFFTEDFDLGFTSLPRRTLIGDWMWRRPVYFAQDATLSLPYRFFDENGNPQVTIIDDVAVPAGSISLFSRPTGAETSSFDEIQLPWNPAEFPHNQSLSGGRDLDNPPDIFIYQSERFYPQIVDGGRPQYAWDCMFRRFEGKILVAIFVYRVNSPSSEGARYRVVATPNETPPLPIRLRLDTVGPGTWDSAMGSGFDYSLPMNDAFNVARTIPGTGIDDGIDPFNAFDIWQLPGQILLDQNNQVHRVLTGRDSEADGPLELTRPISPVLGNPFDPFPGAAQTESPNFYFGEVGTAHPVTGEFQPGMVQEGVVTDIWYLPDSMEINLDGVGPSDATYSITPVYVTVREL